MVNGNLSTGKEITSEEEHWHKCWSCGDAWSHASDGCETVSPWFHTEAACPECEE